MIRVSVDFDGTLARSTDLVCDLINFRRGTTFDAKQVRTWAFWKEIGHEEDFWAAYDLLDRANLRIGMKPYCEDTAIIMQALHRERDWILEVVTMNAPSAQRQIEDWLRRHGVHNMAVRCLGRPPALHAGTAPSSGASKLDHPYHVYVDDAPALAREVAARPERFLLLANAPWNQDVPEAPNVRRFHRWHEVPDLLAVAREYVRKVGTT